MKNTFYSLVSVFIIVSVTLLSTGCKEKKTLPVITTTNVSDIDLASAVGGGTIADDGGSTITERGICWNTAENPTINDYIAVDNTDGDGFEAGITSLQWATTYYVRAYATNSEGTAYGENVTFTTSTPYTLVYIDAVNGDDKVEEALASQRCNVTTVFNSTDFATGLASGNYDLAVLFTQSYSTMNYSSTITKDLISTFINGGGMMIYSTWDKDNDIEYAALFNAGFSGATNITNVTITDPLIIGKTGISTYTVENHGYGVFSTGLTVLTGGTALANFDNGDAAMIQGNEGHTIMLGYLSSTPSTKIQEIFESILMKLNYSL